MDHKSDVVGEIKSDSKQIITGVSKNPNSLADDYTIHIRK